MALAAEPGHRGTCPPLEEIFPHSAPPSSSLVVCIVANSGITPPSRTSGIWVTNMTSEAISEHLIFKNSKKYFLLMHFESGFQHPKSSLKNDWYGQE